MRTRQRCVLVAAVASGLCFTPAGAQQLASTPAAAPLASPQATASPVEPAAAVTARMDPSGTNLVVPATNGITASVVFPACAGASGATVTLRALAPEGVAASPLGGTVLAAHELVTDHDLECRALPSVYYGLSVAQRASALVVEVRDERGASLGTIDQYRLGTTAFEGGMFPTTAAATVTRFVAGEHYVIALRADPPSMVSEPVTFEPTDMTPAAADGLAFEAHVPAAVSGGGRIVVRTSIEPPAGVPPLVTRDGAPALAYLSAVAFGSVTFDGEGRLSVRPSAKHAGAVGIAMYDAERWTAGWTPLPATTSRDAAGRYVFRMRVPRLRAVFKRAVFAVYPSSRTARDGAAPFVSLGYVPPAGRPLVTIVGDSSVILTAVSPSPVGCKLDFAPPPACQMSANPVLAVPGRLAAALPGAEVVQLAWLGTSAGDVENDDSELTWQVPQIPAASTAVIFTGGTQDVVLDPGADLRPRLETIVAAIRSRAPHARLVFVGIRYFNDTLHDPVRKPMIDGFDERERQLADTSGGAFIDLRTLLPSGFSSDYPDGAHPSPESARTIAHAIVAQLRLADLGRIVPP